MAEPSIYYSCSQCGQSQRYRLVPEVVEEPVNPPAEIPSIDLACAGCGATATYMLVPASSLSS